MKNSKKRGFTIVELVIVIAVIAILAGVLIPTFVSVINKANESTDTALIKYLNTSLKSGSVGQEQPKTMQQALDIVEADGYNVAKIKATASGASILWDSVNNCFAYLKKGTELTYIPDSGEQSAKDVDLWKIVTAESEISDKYSNYVAYEIGSETIEVTTGLDVGKNTGVSINYTRTAGAKQSVVFNMNGGTLTVNAPADDVHRYGVADKVVITAVAPTSYYECGEVKGNIELQAGHVNVSAGAKVNGIVVTANSIIQGNDGKYNVSVSVVNNASVDFVTSTENIQLDNIVETTNETKVIDKTTQPSDAVAYDLASGEYLNSLTVSKNSHIVILKDIDVANTIVVQNSVVIDLNGHTISTPSQVFAISTSANSGDVTVKFVGNGLIKEIKQDQYGALLLSNPKVNNSNLKVIVEKNVTLCGWTGIGIMSSDYTKYQNITVDFAGKIVSSADTTSSDPAYGHGIYVNGGYKTIDQCPEFIIRETAQIDQGQGAAIYAAGYARWTIYGGAFKAGECFEIKAGEVNIFGGTFDAIGELSHEPCGNGTSANGYGLAIVNNNSYAKPISVNVYGGEFKRPVEILLDSQNPEFQAVLKITGGNFMNDVSKYR